MTLPVGVGICLIHYPSVVVAEEVIRGHAQNVGELQKIIYGGHGLTELVFLVSVEGNIHEVRHFLLCQTGASPGLPKSIFEHFFPLPIDITDSVYYNAASEFTNYKLV